MDVFSEGDLAEGRRLVAQLDASQWALGDLAIRVAGPSSGLAGAKDGSYGKLADFASQIGVDGEQLARYRSVATAWPPQDRIDGATWTLHRTIASRPERVEELGRFVARCDADGVTPTRPVLRLFLSMPVPGGPEPDKKDPTWRPPWVWEEMQRWRQEGRAFEIPVTVERAATLADELGAQTSYLIVFARQYVFAILAEHPEWYADLKVHLAWLDALEAVEMEDEDLPEVFPRAQAT